MKGTVELLRAGALKPTVSLGQGLLNTLEAPFQGHVIIPRLCLGSYGSYSLVLLKTADLFS
jgi:hypothetical protein